MPPRQPALPEGTDHVVRGASAEDDAATSLGAAKDKLVGQVREQVSTLRSQATDRARGFVQSAQSLALREGHQQFSPDHLLVALRGRDRAGWQERGLLDSIVERFEIPVTVFELSSG